MFEERPFRQHRHSSLSIWWFAGFMAAGLSAWHLELLPFTTPSVMDLGLQDPDFEEHEPSPLTLHDSNRVPDVSASRDSLDSYSAPSSIQLAGFEQPRGESAPSGQIPTRTLNYRADLEPVPPRLLPTAQGPPPIQTAGYQQSSDETVTASLQTALASRTIRDSAEPPEQFPSEPGSDRLLEQNDPNSSREPAPSQEPSPLDPAREQEIQRLRELSVHYWKQPQLRIEIDPEMRELSRTIYFQPEVHYLPAYKVQPNDQLRLIARNYQVSWQYLARLNRIEPEQIRVGQDLKVMQGPFGAVVDLSDRTLTVHAHGYYVCSFPVAVGKDHATPTGDFPVLNKVENPTYYGPDGVVSADDPRNPLGEHWIDLGNSCGIHGTIDPSSIGSAVSKGCIRMRPDDVALVYDLLTLESVVRIRE